MTNIFGTLNGCNAHNRQHCARCEDAAACTPRQRAINYFHRTSNGDQKLFEDRLQRYDANYNGMRDHWDRTLPFILGLKEIPLNERRGQ